MEGGKGRRERAKVKKIEVSRQDYKVAKPQLKSSFKHMMS